MAKPPPERFSELFVVERGEDGPTAVLADFWGGGLGADALARAVLAAAASAPGRELRALRAVFPAPPPAGTPLAIRVRALGTDGADAHREVELAADTCVCRALAGFAAPEPAGPSHRDVALPGDLPDPEALPSTAACAAAEGWSDYAAGPVEFRRIGPLWPDGGPGQPREHRAWMKPRAPLPPGPAARDAAIAFLADFYPHWGFERRLGPAFDPGRFERLGIALFVHEPVAWRDWWLLRAGCEVAGGGLAVSHRELWTRDGRLVATAVHDARLPTA